MLGFSHLCVVIGRAFKCDKGTTCTSLARCVGTMDSALGNLLLMIIKGLVGKTVSRNLILRLGCMVSTTCTGYMFFSMYVYIQYPLLSCIISS